MGTSNFYLDNGSTSFDELLRQAEGGVLIAEVSGVHSARIRSRASSASARPACASRAGFRALLREMTIASTLPQMLAGITGVGDDLRFFSSVGTPSVLIGEMTLAGV